MEIEHSRWWFHQGNVTEAGNCGSNAHNSFQSFHPLFSCLSTWAMWTPNWCLCPQFPQRGSFLPTAAVLILDQKHSYNQGAALGRAYADSPLSALSCSSLQDSHLALRDLATVWEWPYHCPVALSPCWLDFPATHHGEPSMASRSQLVLLYVQKSFS